MVEVGAAFAGAAIAGAIGTGLAIAATRDAYAYDAPAYYGGGPVYYDEGPVYYGGQDSYIGPRPFTGAAARISRGARATSRPATERRFPVVDHEQAVALAAPAFFAFYCRALTRSPLV